MAINELPEEILVHILSLLDRSDRLESALTCRQWAQTIARVPSLLKDVWLLIGKNEMKEAETVFADSHRQYENLRFDGVSLRDFNAAFWTNVGSTLRKLELFECDGSSEVFHSILQACSNLESLKISARSEMFPLSELPPVMNLEKIQKSMRKLRHLHLDFRMNADILEHLLTLMPNVSSIDLLHFGHESDFLSRLSNILGVSRRITMLELDWNLRGEQFLRISSTSLRTFKYQIERLSPKTLDALRNCSMLRDLNFRLSYLHDSDIILLQNILRNFPALESLSICIEHWTLLTREDLMPIFELRNLRKLELSLDTTESDTYVIVSDLSRMISLESLKLGGRFPIDDATQFRILARMPNLRELSLCIVHHNAERLRMVDLFDLGKLRTLSIYAQWLCLVSPVMRDRHSELERNISTPEDHSRSDPPREQKISSLEALEVCCIRSLTDAFLGGITAYHCRLKIVRIWGCQGITDAGLVTLFQNEPLLEELEISGSYNVYGTFLEALEKLCRRLRSLRVGHSGEISSRAWEEFRLRRPRVKCKFW